MSNCAPKVTLLGAGSGFTQPLFTDILNIEGLDGGVIGLVDIDGKRLEVNVRLMERVLDLMGKRRWTIDASMEREDVLPGTDYLISTIEVSGTKCVRWDNDIPAKYGIDQCIGDTIGPGGVMKALRTLPVLLDILDDAERLCPDALVMNYTNPMSMITLGATRYTNMPFLGLCHSVQGTSRKLARVAGVPYEEMAWRCGGINHMAWFTELSHKGKDLYPVLRGAMEDPDVYETDPVRWEMMREFGYFVTESSGHFSEYVPYFRTSDQLRKKYCRDRYKGGTSFYADSWPQWRKDVDKKRRAMAAGRQDIPLERGHEYASDIIEAHQFDRKRVVYASVPNTGLIPNLSARGVVEVAVMLDKQGITPTHFGELPEQLAALCRANMSVFELVVSGILEEDREAIVHAMMLDPLCAAVTAPAEIRQMADELLTAEKRYIPSWASKKPRVRIVRSRKRNGDLKDGAAEMSSMAARNVGCKNKQTGN